MESLRTSLQKAFDALAVSPVLEALGRNIFKLAPAIHMHKLRVLKAVTRFDETSVTRVGEDPPKGSKAFTLGLFNTI